MTVEIALGRDDAASVTKAADGSWEICPDLSYVRLAIVNVVFYGQPGGDQPWVLIDTGLGTSSQSIGQCAERRFGGRSPQAIVLTHGHFDHVGAAATLLEKWDCPIYAHADERPYLDGSQSYPPPDPWVGGGVMALLSPLFPRGPVDLQPRLKTLPEDVSVPGMPGWQWLHTPGHAPGHVSLWRDSDRTLVAGDAVITTGQELAYEVALQKLEMHGPPRYFTPDWDAAEQSVRRLSELNPATIVSGHGQPAAGPNMRRALKRLAGEFQTIAVG